MKRDYAAIANQCSNDWVKLCVLSAQDHGALEGFVKAWPDYFMPEECPTGYPVHASVIMASQQKWLLNHTIAANADAARYMSESDWRAGCATCSIPVIEILWPTHEKYGQTDIKATRGLLFQLGDFSEAKAGTVVTLYHAKWVVVYLDKENKRSIVVAPLECIDLER